MVTPPHRRARNVIQLDDPVRIRALAHPARLAIIEHLRDGVTATATELADVVGLSPSATSYHLRELARGGLIREAEGRGDGRERVWQGAGDGFSYDSDKLSDDLQRDEAYGLLGALLGWQEAQAQRYYAELPGMPREWQDASTVYGGKIVATPAELRDLAQQIRRLCERYRSDARPAPDGAERVSIVFRALPSPAGLEQTRPDPAADSGAASPAAEPPPAGGQRTASQRRARASSRTRGLPTKM
jgi:DNA-binding transcriptional ArsR family regulator